MSGIDAAAKASFSQLSTLAQCEAKFQYRYTTDLSDVKGAPLILGSLVGAGCREMWESKAEWTMNTLTDVLVELGADHNEVVSTAIWLLDRYWARYKADIISFDGEVKSELHLEATLPNGITLQGYFDHLLLPTVTAPTLVERKTMKNWQRLDNLLVDPQITLYFWLARENGIDVGSVLFDAIKTYRWALEKPTQKQLIEDAAANGHGFASKKAATEWAREAVARHPGVEAHPPADSFQQAWLFRDEFQVEQALAWAEAALSRRTDLLRPGYVPIRNLGPLCGGCGYQGRCYDDLAFPAEGDIELVP